MSNMPYADIYKLAYLIIVIVAVIGLFAVIKYLINKINNKEK